MMISQVALLLTSCTAAAAARCSAVVLIATNDDDNVTPHRDSVPDWTGQWTMIFDYCRRVERRYSINFPWFTVVCFKIGCDAACDAYLRDTGRRNNNNNNNNNKNTCSGDIIVGAWHIYDIYVHVYIYTRIYLLLTGKYYYIIL